MKIYAAINAIMQDIPAIEKNQRNQQQNFMYRGIDVVMNVLQPLLVKHKVFVVPEILTHDREERTSRQGGNLIYSVCSIRYTFFSAEDGSSISAVVIGEGMDSGDKATNKAMAVAFKYACFQVFCIPTEEMKDPDSESPEAAGGGKAPTRPKKAASKPVSAAPKAPELVCEQCGGPITNWSTKDGKKTTAEETAKMSKQAYGKQMCIACAIKQKKANEPKKEDDNG